MRTSLSSWKLDSRYVTTVNKLFQGLTPAQIAPNSSDQQFWNAFFSLDIDWDFLTKFLTSIPKDACLDYHKSAINNLFTACVRVAQQRDEDEAVRGHAIETLSILLRNVLMKGFAGWEVMEIFAGGVNQSDAVFMEFVDMVAQYFEDDGARASVRHQALQLVVTYTCGVAQLSPAAYLLRRDLFTSIAKLVKSPDTERFTFEAVILLSLLANFHKSDAAKLNPYLQRIQTTTDAEFMRKLCWAANFACDTAVRAFQEIMDDSIPTFSKSVGTLIASLRPDRALSPLPLDLPRELFKDQPIEASVALLPLSDFLHLNPVFTRVFLDATSNANEKAYSNRISPLPYTVLSLSSYILTHASSSASRRAMSYANLTMNLLLIMSDNARIMETFCQPSIQAIRLCRQRQPLLSTPSPSRPPLCALLDCCTLWLRHNLHKRLEVHTYITCISTCYRAIWYLQKVRKRLDYRWPELWSALLGLLAFLCNRASNVAVASGMQRLIQETVHLLDLVLCKAEVIVLAPDDIHTLVYELVRSSNVLQGHTLLLQSFGQDGPKSSLRSDAASKALRHLLSVASYYEDQLSATSTSTAKDALRTLARLIEKDGLYGANGVREAEEPLVSNRPEDTAGFLRFAYEDALSLMP